MNNRMNHDIQSVIRAGSATMLNPGDDSLSLRCPRCHSVMVEICLTSMPPQYEASCYNCGFNVKFQEREDSYKHLTQGEVSKIYNKQREQSNRTKPYENL